MKKIYKKPVLEVESFVTEEIMETFNPQNVLSYGGVATDAGYGADPSSANFINFNNKDTNGQVLNSIDYDAFK